MCDEMSITEVRRGLFNQVADYIESDLNDRVAVRYNGNSFRGTLCIKEMAGYGREYKRAIEFFAKIYCQ